MSDITIIRRDSYLDPFWLYTFEAVLADTDPIDPGGPMNLGGWEIRTTFRGAIVPIETDPTDTGVGAVFTGLLIVEPDGTPSTEDGLYMVGDAADGTFALRMTSADTEGLTPGTPLVSDLQFTYPDWDGNGNDLVRTITYTDTLTAVDSPTNRLTG